MSAMPITCRNVVATVFVLWSVAVSGEEPFTFHSPLAEDWYNGGEYFEWTSTTKNNNGRKTNVFYRTFGDRGRQAVELLLRRGFESGVIPRLVVPEFVG